jgi:GDP-4-dehydro-6-deoxy-D-mannose reductase
VRILITGVTGMAGSHLAEYAIKQNDVEVFGIYRWRSKLENLEELIQAGKVNIIAEGGNIARTEELRRRIGEEAKPGKLNLLDGDIGDASSMKRLIEVLRPDRIFHLAAQSYVPASWSAPADTMRINILGQVNLFEAIREAGIDPLVQIAGSSEEYGLVYPDEVPMKESNPLRPLSPYAVTKVAQELMARQYFYSYGLKTVVTRGFNHTGPRRGHVFVTSSFAHQIALIEKGKKEPVIDVGDLSSKRDWTDVRDTVRGYWLALEKGEPGEVYNVGSGRAYAVGEMLDILLRFSKVQIDVRQDPCRLRPSDVKILWCDGSKFREQTGWAPEIPFETTMRDLLDYWRNRV